MSKYTRFITLGDSMTEGMCDDIVDGQYRGWADRVADVLARNNHGFSYFNLAIRGKLLHQVIADQIPIAKRYIHKRWSPSTREQTTYCGPITNQQRQWLNIAQL
jgi:hypothetical protein